MQQKPLEFGIFLPIANNGWIISHNSPKYMPTYDLNNEVCQIAESIDFDFVLSMVKWRGYGGETRHWDFALESMTLMAGLAASTKKMQLYGSVQPLTFNPAVLAKMATTIDDISGGRFGINIVAGWAKHEYDQLGVWPGDEFFDYRYDYAEEWVTSVKSRWQTGECTFHGKFFDIEECTSLPMPSRMPGIVTAGASERGLKFALDHCSVQFGATKDLEVKAQMEAKGIKQYSSFPIIHAETDAEAQRIQQGYGDGPDQSAKAGQLKTASADKNGTTATLIRTRIEGGGDKLQNNVPALKSLVGNGETIAEKIRAYYNEGLVDGMLFTFPDFVKGMEFFARDVMPKLEGMGLPVGRNKKLVAA